ncbi:hypothetical protein Bsub01_04014 [Bacillus subtilis]|nr:hypothetical protein BSNN_44010 [Bacillus subtilis subsp. natto]
MLAGVFGRLTVREQTRRGTPINLDNNGSQMEKRMCYALKYKEGVVSNGYK